MKKDVLLNRKVNILTIPEYIELQKKYYTTKGNEQTVVWCFSQSGYQFFTKHKTLEDIAHIYYRHEPMVRNRVKDESEVLSMLQKSQSEGIAGVSFRWLLSGNKYRDEVCLQPFIIPAINTEAYIDKMSKIMLRDKMFGFLSDPFTYVGELDEENFDRHDPKYSNPENYRVFAMNITIEDYNSMEQQFIDSIKTRDYNDGLKFITFELGVKYTDEFKDFLNRHTHFNL